MRRRLERFIPIVLLVVLVQLLAPIAAFRVVAYASSDPLYAASICSDMAASSDQQNAPSPHPHGECCAICAIGHAGGIAFEPPSPVFLTLQLQFQKIAWLEAARPTPTVRLGSNAQARAPPFIS
jgi:Protein of unknown function (DUF2946)